MTLLGKQQRISALNKQGEVHDNIPVKENLKISINKVYLEQENEVQFFGLIMDKLKWTEHLEALQSHLHFCSLVRGFF